MSTMWQKYRTKFHIYRQALAKRLHYIYYNNFGGNMKQFDTGKLKTAITYIERVSEGKNPVNNMPELDGSILYDPNIIRCMSFIKEVLQEVENNNGYIGRASKKISKPDFPLDILNGFSYKQDKPISKVVDQINELVDENKYNKLNYKIITNWLKSNGYLSEGISEELNRKATFPTEKGKQIGLRTEKRSRSTGSEYIVIIYGKQAQEFLIYNMKDILTSV